MQPYYLARVTVAGANKWVGQAHGNDAVGAVS